jgi:hypothetical protein
MIVRLRTADARHIAQSGRETMAWESVLGPCRAAGTHALPRRTTAPTRLNVARGRAPQRPRAISDSQQPAHYPQNSSQVHLAYIQY